MRVLSWLLFAVVLCACECGAGDRATQPSAPELRVADESSETETVIETEASEEAVGASSFFSTPPPPRLGPPTPEQASSFADASNRLGIALYRAARSEDGGNFAISPASITLAFDMVYAGARGETAAEMSEVMAIDPDSADVHEAAGRVLAGWNDPDREDYDLRVVNRLFGEQTFTFDQDYLTLTRTKYGAPLTGVDFIGAPDEQRADINGWVGEQTRDRITDLLPGPSITSATRLVLVNAVYFLGRWETPFESTSNGTFNLPNGLMAQVPLMGLTGEFRLRRRDDLTVVDLPYEGDDIVMTLVIPNEVSGLGAIEESLSVENLASWINSMPTPRSEVRLVVPRFEMKAKRALSEHLTGLGMRRVFDSQAADLSGIAPPSPAGDRLFITEAYHQAFVKVDEAGTEAAAATAVVVGITGMAPAPPAEIRADRPFLFAIRERASGTILFLGRVTDPR